MNAIDNILRFLSKRFYLNAKCWFYQKMQIKLRILSTFYFQKSAAIYRKKIHWDESFHSLNVTYILLHKE